MSKVKIQGNASGTGVVTLTAPNTNTDRTITLPDSTGSILDSTSTLDATKLSGALPAIDGSALTGMSGGLYSSVAIICDQKAAGVQGGTFTSGAWRTRDLNTEIIDADGIVSIASNQFTLQAGTYTIEWEATGYLIARHKSKLRNITTSADTAIGTSAYSWVSGYNTTLSIGKVTITLAGATAFEIQHYCESTSVDNDGFGIASDGTGGGSTVEKYAMVKILKHT